MILASVLVEYLPAKVEELLFAECGKLVATERVLVVVEEDILSSQLDAVGSDDVLELLGECLIEDGLAEGRIASSVASENVDHGDLAVLK